MSEIRSPSTGRRYSIKRVCAVWQTPRSTVHSQLRRSSLTDLPVPRKRGPVGAASDEELVSLIRKEIDASPFHGEGHRKIWARLRFQGVRTSKDRVCRLMRENGLQARPGRRRERRVHEGTIITEKPDQMWGTDLTQTLTRVSRQPGLYTCKCNRAALQEIESKSIMTRICLIWRELTPKIGLRGQNLTDTRILVVDDDPGVRSILRKILTGAGHHVSEAQDGTEALQLIANQPYDLITMDLVMDRMDGVDAISVLINEAQTPVLVISAHLTDEIHQDLLDRGITEWIDKPFSAAKIQSTVERLIAGHTSSST